MRHDAPSEARISPTKNHQTNLAQVTNVKSNSLNMSFFSGDLDGANPFRVTNNCFREEFNIATTSCQRLRHLIAKKSKGVPIVIKPEKCKFEMI